MLTVMTNMKLRFAVVHGNEKLSWTSQGNNIIEQAPDWIEKSDMFRATNGVQLTVLNTSPIIKVADVKPKVKEVIKDGGTESV